MTSLRQAWAALPSRLRILEPVAFPPAQWPLIERLHAGFNDRDAHTHLPIPIARFRDEARTAIFALAQRLDAVETVSLGDGGLAAGSAEGTAGAMARYARLYDEEVDAMMRVLVPPARFRKGHYAYGRFTVPAPHGLHTDHSAEDPGCGGEPICIARIETLGTHHVVGDERAHDAATARQLQALRHWTAVAEGEPEEVLDALLRRGILGTIPVNHVMLMVAGNRSENAQITQHIAARPPEGGVHSAFFQRQYRLR